jgi:hypothetical protein
MDIRLCQAFHSDIRGPSHQQLFRPTGGQQRDTHSRQFFSSLEAGPVSDLIPVRIAGGRLHVRMSTRRKRLTKPRIRAVDGL